MKKINISRGRIEIIVVLFLVICGLSVFSVSKSSKTTLFYNNDIIPTKDNLLNIRVTSFCQKEVDLLRYVENKKLIDLDMLDGFSVEVCELLEKYTNMPSDRAEKIAQTIVQKVEYLKLFQQGKKIWKKEKYW